MLPSFAISVTIAFVVGIVTAVTLAARAAVNDSIARVLYDVEHPEKIKWARARRQWGSN